MRRRNALRGADGRARPARRIARALFGLAVALSGPAGAEPRDLGRISVATLVDYSEGDYDGEERSDILYAALDLAYLSPELPLTPVADWLELRVNLPYLQVDGPGVLAREGLFPAESDSDTTGGLGDIGLRLGYWLDPPGPRWLPAVELAVRAKLPTADEDRGLGTGRTDWGVELGLSERLGRTVLFAGGGRRFMGEPRGTRLRDRWLASLGLSRELGRGLELGLLYDYRSASSREGGDAHDLILFGWARVGKRVDFGPYGLLGLGPGSPDFAVGAQLRVRLDLIQRD